jgi:hypothetical protein
MPNLSLSDVNSRKTVPAKFGPAPTPTRPMAATAAKIHHNGDNCRPTPCRLSTDTRRAARKRRCDLRRALPHLYGTNSQSSLVGLPEKAFVPFAARPGSEPPLARLVARSPNAGNGDCGSQRRAPLGTGGNPVFDAPAAAIVVGIAVSALSGQHANLAAALSLDRPQSVPPQRWANLRRRYVRAASRDLNYSYPCSLAGKAPERTSSRYCVTARVISLLRSAYALTNRGM